MELLDLLKQIQNVIDQYGELEKQDATQFKQSKLYKWYFRKAMENPYGEFEQLDLPAFDYFRQEMISITKALKAEIPSLILLVNVTEQNKYAERISSLLKYYLHLLNTQKKENPFFEIFIQLLEPLLTTTETIKAKYLATECENKKGYQIQWNAGAATLGTLFFELRKTNFRNNDPYITSPTQDIINFVMEHFVDSERKPFNYNSIATYIGNEGKEKAKRHKFSIEALEADDDEK